VGGDRTPLGLYSAHRQALTGYASGIVGDHARAEDVVQEAWLRFGTAMGKGPLDEPVGYLYRIVRNLAVDCRRRMAREHIVVGESLSAAESVPDERGTPEAVAVAREDLRLLIDAMEELPERTRIAIEMRRIDGCKLKEIAARLGVSVPVAYQIVAEGLAHCRRRVRPGP
jgi:RNA polymerase sigma factor (sigma-70 family)